jgi:ribonuclease BN (tRNA processing enzyme)
VPEPERYPSGVLVEAGDEVIVVDLGSGIVRRLAQAGVSLDRVTTVLLTHYHPDHCADLVALLFACRNPSLAARPPLRILGGPGLHALLAALRAAWPRWLEAHGYVLEEREIGPGAHALAGVELAAIAVEHRPESLALRLCEEGTGATVTVSGDADSVDGLVEAARDSDLFVCEAAFPEHESRGRHISALEAGRAAAAAGTRLLCLTHLYPDAWEGHDPILEAARAYDGQIVLARDLLQIEIGAARGEIVVRDDRART